MNHSVRFVRALVLAAALPGCSAAEDPAHDTEPQTTEPSDPAAGHEHNANAPAITPRTIASADAAPTATIDASLPKTSGPITPPEMETT